MNRDLKSQLARAFGLAPGADVDALIATLRAGGPVDAETLRRGCLALVDDVREASDARAISDQRLKIAVKASNLAIWEWNIAAGTVLVDPTLHKFLGREDHALLWSTDEIGGLIHPDDFQKVSDATRASLETGAPMHSTHRMLHSDGRWVWIDAYGDVTQRDPDGRPVSMTGTHADVTERRQLERALSNTLRVMHALLETLPLPVIIRDVDLRVTLVNEAFERMTGVSREKVVGQSLYTDPSVPRAPSLSETDRDVLEHKRALNYETVITTADGKVYDVLIAKTPLLAEDGSVTGIASVVTDISRQKRTNAALERARATAEAAVQAKSRFLANMSHELRTPLNGVVGMASLLENTALDARQRRFVRTLKSSAEALITLINDVLDLSKAEAGKLGITHAPFDLRREMEQVVSLFTGRAHDKGIELAAHIARDVPATINGDPLRLRQVLGNLVNNAVKFTESGAVLLSVGAVPGQGGEWQLEFAVSDTGVGVAPAEQQRIFDAFEQADGSVTRKFGGTGLGLAISRQLVELMHGTMSLESEVGRGSRFYFRIPAGVPRVVPPLAPPAPELGVVVIGLHPLVRAAACEALAAHSPHVVGVETAADAVDALRRCDARVTRVRLFIDVHSPAQLESALGPLRRAAQPRAVEIIALLPPDADGGATPGVTRSLVKPLCTPDLLAAAAPDTGASTRIRALPDNGSRGLALVVEDNAVNLEMARTMLDMLGFNVLTACNGREGVEVAAGNPGLRLIFMDCQMPVMDGLTAARAIRASEAAEGRRVPIVALTGNAMPGDREACVAAGMDDYLAKPFSLTALRKMIDKWTGAPVSESRIGAGIR